MAALNFPFEDLIPGVTTYTANGFSWLWNGSSWVSNNIAPVGATGPTGPTGLSGINGIPGVTGPTGPAGAGSDLTLSDDTTTTGPYYLTMSNASSGVWDVPYISSTQLYFDPSTGTLSAVMMETLSDITLKENIRILQNGRKIIDLLEPIEFTWKNSGEKSYGLSAQQVELIVSNLVSKNNGILTINYNGVIPFLISAVQELSENERKLVKTIKELTKRIEQLESHGC
jgi:hypothetical protein